MLFNSAISTTGAAQCKGKYDRVIISYDCISMYVNWEKLSVKWLVMGWATGVHFPVGTKNFLFPTMSRPAPGSTKPPLQ